jgi:hypothetical protein
LKYFDSKSGEFEEQLNGENRSEEYISYIEEFGVPVGLSVELHPQRNRVEHDEGEIQVFESLGGDNAPNAVLPSVLWNVVRHWLRLQRKFQTVPLKIRKKANLKI